MNDLNKTDVERYNIIYDMLQNMEKRFENNNVCMFAQPQPVRKRDVSDMTNKDDYRRVQKAKKDHRRTRVIYKVPEVDVSLVKDHSKNVSSIDNTTICFDVKENSLSDSLSVDDNSTKDPDWSKTPIHRRPRRTINRKSGIERRRSKLTKNSSNITSKYGENAEASLNG
ncbi:hypothetical protein BpHYR1_010120 [Brachionus plicatilis]|uniref:Uncharacterized protein n=1 Tax=Brachionus plicatilis TaxID=10195 RepID=A0A3M7R8Q5_BRAPC|nr:hypothetical protein BpHYR1_010120 [Brachionus plicatilis]